MGMSETAVLESSPTEVPAMEVDRGPLVNLNPEQRQQYRKTGELPKEAPAPSSEPNVAKPAAESEAAKQQEKPKAKPTAEERIAQLESTIEKIKAKSGLDKPKAESEPAKSEAKPIVQAKRPTPEDTKADGTPKFATSADYEDALLDWKLEQREATKAATAQQEAHSKLLNEKLEDARTRYTNLDEVIQPAANVIYQDPKISPVIKQMIGDSDLIVDLVFTIGNDQAELAKFVKMAQDDPGKAIRYIALTESLIAQELETRNTPAPEEPPAKSRTQAPKPPAEAGGRAATPPDSLQAALEGSGGKLNSGLKAEFLRRDLAKLRG
jgi:hypothetical protein